MHHKREGSITSSSINTEIEELTDSLKKKPMSTYEEILM